MSTKLISYEASNPDYPGVHIVTWKDHQVKDTGQPIIVRHFESTSVQVFGEFDTTGTLILEGSNTLDGSVWDALRDIRGEPTIFKKPEIKQVWENTFWIRPHVTAGTKKTLLTVALCVATATQTTQSIH